jgi:hypothetical protein
MPKPRQTTRLTHLFRRLTANQDGATTLEWTLLMGAIALPGYFIIKMALAVLIAHYQMVTTLNALPFP